MSSVVSSAVVGTGKGDRKDSDSDLLLYGEQFITHNKIISNFLLATLTSSSQKGIAVAYRSIIGVLVGPPHYGVPPIDGLAHQIID
jgi:hypothetical protein